jgi:hypothetical protein
MVWTPFCVSFRPVERSSVFFHFFRAQVVSLFFVIWVLPNTSPLDLLPILPALAILSGAHFEILMRRHKWHLERYLSLLAWLALIVSSGCLLLGALHVLGVVPMVGFSSLVLAWNAGILAVVALFATLALRSRKENGLPYWFRFMIAVCALRLIVAAVNAPLEAWVGNERRQVAMVLAGKMPAADLHGGNGPMSPDLRPVDLPTPNVLPGSGATTGDSVPPPNYRAIQPRLGLPEDVKTVYVYRPPLVTESFYLGCMTIRVTDLARDLPSTEPVVYVLGGAQAPILPSRIWTPVSPVLDSHRRNELFWSWVLADGCLLEFRVVPRPESPDYRPNPICLYRGELR